jgi:GrpB-like predicted nucleotidyltransferase (UPF0157 family)/predicted enzyme related to lactoylglutathione lyase
MESHEQRLRRVRSEAIVIVPYDAGWPEAFRREREHLRACLPPDLVGRIEHYGSTAVPGLAAKPIVDMLVEVRDLGETRARVVPVLEARGYEYFWRPTTGDDGPPFYAWFIKRDPRTGARTHHIHMVESSFTGHWDALRFRDHLIAHPEVASEYEALKRRLAAATSGDRVAYTQGKTEFIVEVTRRAKDRRQDMDLANATVGQLLIPVEDLDRAIAFYRDALGLRFLFAAPPQMSFFQAGEVRLLVGVPEAGRERRRGSTVYFKVADIHAVSATLAERGVEFPAAPHVVHRMPAAELWLAEFADPDGNPLALMSEAPRPGSRS